MHNTIAKYAQRRFPWQFSLLTFILALLLAACGPSHSPTQSTSATPTATAPTHTATTPASNTATTIAPTSSTATTALPADCPAPGTVRPASMPSITTAAQPAVFYITELGGVQSGIWAKDLNRYDLATGKTNTILSFPQPSSTGGRVTAAISLSPDKHWLLISIGSQDGTATTRLQLMRTDGTQLQTLFCNASWGTPLWSPDEQHIAFSASRGNGPIATVYIDILDLTTGRIEQIPAADYTPQAWLDTTRLYVERQNGTPKELSLLDISKGQNQQPGNFAHVISINTPCGTFEPNYDGTQLYTTSCTQVTLDNCQGGNGIQGPSMLNTQPATGGKATTIYSSPSQAIFALHVVNTQTILFYIDNSAGDLSQNGLWKINANGNGLTRLTTAVGSRCFDPYFEYWPQITSNSLSYAQLTTTFTSTGPAQAIQVGSLSGGVPTTIATPDPTARPGMLLVLIGMA